MTKSGRLQRVAEISRKAEQTAAQTLATSRRQLDNYRQQMHELEAYREEYRARFRSGSATPMNGFEAQKLSAFITQVDRVIDGLHAKIAHATQTHNLQRDAWAQQRSRVDALDGVAGRARRQEQNAEEARDQREIDDRVPMKNAGVVQS